MSTKLELWQWEDANGSFCEAVAEIGRQVKAGGALPTTGYFAREMTEAERECRASWFAAEQLAQLR
jgi:hypothetical protein